MGRWERWVPSGSMAKALLGCSVVCSSSFSAVDACRSSFRRFLSALISVGSACPSPHCSSDSARPRPSKTTPTPTHHCRSTSSPRHDGAGLLPLLGRLDWLPSSSGLQRILLSLRLLAITHRALARQILKTSAPANSCSHTCSRLRPSHSDTRIPPEPV